MQAEVVMMGFFNTLGVITIVSFFCVSAALIGGLPGLLLFVTGAIVGWTARDWGL